MIDVKYPMLRYWGEEYLIQYYDKIINGNHISISTVGDSTLLSADVSNEFKRTGVIERIMTKVGGYPENSVTVHNNGVGGSTMGDFLVNTYDSVISQNPDLIIVMHGINDMTATNGDLESRLNLFESRLVEFLKRLRYPTTETVNGKICYGLDETNTSVILCVPTVAYSGRDGRAEGWNEGCRRIIYKLCRMYKCGFYDCGIPTYDYGRAVAWSTDSVHPHGASIASFMSGIQPLIMPVGLWGIHSS